MSTDLRASAAPVSRNVAPRLCLIVHDDLELRLRMAALVRQADATLRSDSVSRRGLSEMSEDRLHGYVALFFIIDFQAAANFDPLSDVTRVPGRSAYRPFFVIARGGDERAAARSIKAGAVDYWPIHSVKVGELRASLLPLLQGASTGRAAGRPPAAPPAAPQICGYRLIRKLAESATATVYLTENDEMAASVALKVQAIGGLRALSAGARKQFVRECQILSSFNHRGIADLLDFGITDEYLFLALEYFPCGSLRERLRNPVSESDAFQYARQIGESLRVVHAAGVVHRDLKPSNVMLREDNRPVLIDFGSALAPMLAGDRSYNDFVTGTPYYAAPEQIDGRDPDARGDLYSLGVVLFEMLVGAVPFAGGTLQAVFDGHRATEVPRLPDNRRRYQPIVDRLLAKDPVDRYQSAASFVEGLDAFAASGRLSTSTARSTGALGA